eukprot:gb/GFBE01070960.1/.p1 GENE.gb/GFBE01070960.1/~~gb/GFBE01070960.1/.p1  ORF type:complete len:303 (+),score=37.98 gb/GFBE01070960.1/:1-909(+)
MAQALSPTKQLLLILLVLLEVKHVPAYDQAVGLSLAYLEKAVYCGEERFKRWDVGESIVKGPRVDPLNVTFVTSSTTQAAAGVGRMTEPDGCFVAMRGTLGPISTLLDAVFWLVDFNQDLCPGCQVVAGFVSAYHSVKEEIFEALEEFGCENRPLHLVGHSQGAASLTYLLFDAVAKGYQVEHMYALESPRPGNKAFAEALRGILGSADAWRVSHYQDIVPHLPPEGLMVYHHALPEIYYEARNGTRFRECGVEEADCSNRWWAWQLTPADHSWYADLNPCSCSERHEVAPGPMGETRFLLM